MPVSQLSWGIQKRLMADLQRGTAKLYISDTRSATRQLNKTLRHRFRAEFKSVILGLQHHKVVVHMSHVPSLGPGGRQGSSM